MAVGADTSGSPLADWMTWALSPSLSAILVTLLVSLSLPVLIHFFLYRRTRSLELPVFVLLGPSGGGKTSLLTLFTTGDVSATHTSQATQRAVCNLPGKHDGTASSSADQYRSVNDPTAKESSGRQITLLDTPGHGKLRSAALDELRNSKYRALLYIVDSAAPDLADAAAFLHDVLLLLQQRSTSSSSSTSTPSPVLVLANKQDVFSSLPPDLVAARLQAEIARVRDRKSRGLLDSAVGGTGAETDEEANWLGEFGEKEFAFEQLRQFGVDVTVLGGSVKGESGGQADTEAWWAWIAEQL